MSLNTNNIKIVSVSIEGNIGSGKSTLFHGLQQYYKDNKKIIFLKEPVDEWEKIKDENGISILKKFYDDQEKYAFPFQVIAFISRLKILQEIFKNIDKDTIIITERSLYTDKMVFAKMLYDFGKIEYINYQIYLSWFDTFANDYPIDKVIYIKTNPEICHYRITKRSREGENNIPLEYLDDCNLYHNNMLNTSSPSCVCNNQLILDGNIDIHENENQQAEWIKRIDTFIHSSI
jgi:deoxyadenosine/deoxycytidine kinase